MVINPNWRILTVGDGDLSFSRALYEQYSVEHLTASILDTEQQLREKYQYHQLDYLRENGVAVEVGVDITNPKTWQHLESDFDLVIFQFPLVPNFKSRHQYENVKNQFGNDFSINTLNRRLLRQFLIHCFDGLLSKNGARLAYISSKDVKPYTEWNIEFALTMNMQINLLGRWSFEASDFPNYTVRNVDRDGFVKDTEAATYVWSDQPVTLDNLFPVNVVDANGCKICQAGPFATEQERAAHLGSAKHRRMFDYDRQWRNYLLNESNIENKKGRE